MSFVSSLLGGGGSDASGGGLGFDIINAQKTEENRLKDETRRFDELALKAGADARTLGMVQDQRQEQIMTNPNKWITSGAGYTGIAGASRNLGGASYQLGT